MKLKVPFYDEELLVEVERKFIQFLKEVELSEFKLQNIDYYGYSSDIVLSFIYHDDNTVIVFYHDGKTANGMLHYQIDGSDVYTLDSSTDIEKDFISSIQEQFVEYFKLKVKLLFY